MALKLSVFKK